MLLPGTPIKLTPADRDKFARELGDIVRDLEHLNQPLFRDIPTWWRWYEATPRTKIKNFPWKSSSNIVVPLIQIQSDAWVARTYASIFGAGPKVWSAHTENEIEESRVKNVVRFINNQANNNGFNYRVPVHDWLHEMGPIGGSVLSVDYREDIRHVFMRQGRGKSARVESQPVRFARGPVFEHIPREQILWDTQFRIHEAPTIVHEMHHPWAWLNYVGTLNGWDTEQLEAIQKSGGITGPSTLAGRQKNESDDRAANPTAGEPHDIRKITLDWPVINAMGFDESIVNPSEAELGRPNIPLVAYYHYRTGRLLHLQAYPYFFPFKNYFDGFIQKRPGRGHAIGLAKKLEHAQQGMTAAINQAIDARTRANLLWAKTTKRDLTMGEIDPSRPLYVGTDINSFDAISLGTRTAEDLGLVQALQVIAERQTGQADPLMGRETRSGGHPSPATSTLFLAGQGDILAFPERDILRQTISLMGEAVAMLYQQYETNEDGRLQRLLGAKDAADVEQFLFPTEPISGNLNFDVVAMSDRNNPDAEMKRAMATSQMNTNYWAFILRAMEAMQVASQQGNQLMMQAAVTSIRAQTEAHIRVLEAGDIDDVEKYVLQLERANDGAPGELRRASGELTDMAAARGAVPQQPVAQGLPLGSAGRAPSGNGALRLQ